MTSVHGGSWSPGSETEDHDPVAPRSLPHVDALDSLRAIAVVGVLAYHQSSGLAPGGWLGVSLFFTLSGFLITNLLLDERERSDRIALGPFWVRRIRRLLPASLVALALAAVVVVVAEAGADVASFGADARAAVLNVANWRFIASGAAYADAAADPSPVQHYWSLAIEEQFYVVLPLLVAFCLPRRRLLAAAVGATVVGSLFLQLNLGGGVDRIYFGTDTRAAELAVGAALALAWPTVRTVASRSPWLADAVGLVALASTAVLFGAVDLDVGVVTSGALVAVTVVWVGLVVGAICGPRFGRALSVPGLPPIGRISYGIYLYHWPIYLLLTPGRVGADGPALFAIRVAVTVALAAVSASLVEVPIRRAEWRPSRTAGFAMASVAVVVAISIVAPTSRNEPAVLAGATLVPAPAVSTTVLPESAEPTVDVAPTTTTAAPAVEPATAPTPPPTTLPAMVTPRVPRLLVVGDSTVANPGVALQEYGAEAGLAEVQLLWSPGCAVVPYEVAVVRPGFDFVSPCGDVLSAATTFAIDDEIDAVVVMMGTLQLADARYAGLEGLHTVFDDAIDSRYRRAMTRSLDRLGAAGIPVLWADLPTPEWDIDEMGEAQGIPVDGSGVATTNDPARAARLNAVDRAVIDQYPMARRWGYEAILAGPDGVIDEDVRYDGVHVSRSLARTLVETSMFGELESVYREIVAGSQTTGTAPPTGAVPTTWDVPRR